MSQRFRATFPLALSIGVVAFVWVEFVLNFAFHWVVVKDGVFGKFGLPSVFTLVLPASFVSWGLFFALGANNSALRKVIVAAALGTIAGIVIMLLGPALAGAPKFWVSRSPSQSRPSCWWRRRPSRRPTSSLPPRRSSVPARS